MLATLFTAMLRMVLAVSRRADTRSDSELERTRSDRDAERARADAERARADAAARRADEFEARYVELLERVKGIT